MPNLIHRWVCLVGEYKLKWRMATLQPHSEVTFEDNCTGKMESSQWAKLWAVHPGIRFVDKRSGMV